MTNYGSALTSVRESAGLSQASLSRETGIHRALLSAVERGKRHAFTVSRTKALANAIMRTKDEPNMDAALGLMALAAGERGIDVNMVQGCSAEALEILVMLVLMLPTMSVDRLSELKKLILS